jgi:hypothetical protein
MKLSARTRSLLAAGLILGMGFAGGTVFGLWVSMKFFTQFVAASVDAPGPGDYLVEKLLRDLERQLDLTETERTAVGAEMRATVQMTKRLRAETTMKLRAVLTDSTDRMAAKMSAEKAKMFRELTARRLRMLGLDELNEPQWQEAKPGK